MVSAICEAIRKRAVIEFHYDGGIRTAEPHLHGTSTAGNEVLRGYQTSGASRSGNPKGWRLYKIEGITSLRETGATFAENRPGFDPNDKNMEVVHCHA